MQEKIIHMYCTKCGKEITKFDRYCSYCGFENENVEELQIDEPSFNDVNKQEKDFVEARKKELSGKNDHVIAILALIFSLIATPVGLILSIYGLVRFKKSKDKNLCIISLIVYVVMFALGVVLIILGFRSKPIHIQ